MAIYWTHFRAAQLIAPSLRELAAKLPEGVDAPTQAWQSVRFGAPPSTARRGGACSSRVPAQSPQSFSGKNVIFYHSTIRSENARLREEQAPPLRNRFGGFFHGTTAMVAQVRLLPQSATPTAPSRGSDWLCRTLLLYNRLPRRRFAPPRNDNPRSFATTALALAYRFARANVNAVAALRRLCAASQRILFFSLQKWQRYVINIRELLNKSHLTI